MKNTTLLLFIVIFVAGGAFFAFTSAEKTDTAVQQTNQAQGDTQKITLSEKNFNYYPDTITVQAGKPVEITLDSSINGCLRSLAIPDLGIAKYARTAAEKIVFTPTKKGTFKFSCSMGMGFGTLVVQ